MTYPLNGIRVLDLSQAVSGPYAGRLLSDLGAEVVKVEWPRGDISNLFGKTINGLSGLFTQMNAGKRGLSVDLGSPAGVEIVRSLAIKADVLIENFRPGVLDRVGLSYERLAAANPGLVMLSISGFGRSGAENARQAYAPVIHAEAGLIERQADVDDRPPVDIAMALADTLSSLHGTIAALAALLLKGRTSTGQHIDLSMLEAMLATDDYGHNAVDREAIAIVPRGQIWDAPGGRILVAADLKTIWARLSDRVGHTGSTDNGDLATKVAARSAAIGTWIAGFDTRADLTAALSSADLAWADLRTIDNVLDSPALDGRDVVAWVDDGAGGRRGVIRSPYRFSNADCDVRGPAPRRGQDTDEVLRDWLGLDQAAITALRDRGALS
jgi:CoA:oxalate CoA-transferase